MDLSAPPFGAELKSARLKTLDPGPETQTPRLKTRDPKPETLQDSQNGWQTRYRKGKRKRKRVPKREGRGGGGKKEWVGEEGSFVQGRAACHAVTSGHLFGDLSTSHLWGDQSTFPGGVVRFLPGPSFGAELKSAIERIAPARIAVPRGLGLSSMKIHSLACQPQLAA